MKRLLAAASVLMLAAITTGCGSDSGSSDAPAAITLVAYDSFPPEKTSLNGALDSFTKSTGIAVKLVIAGDTGTMVTKAKLTAGNPEGDVMFGVDNTFLSSALEGNIFDRYQPNGWNEIATNLTALVPGHEMTPVDFGDVCVNYDIGWFKDKQLKPPATLDDLLKPEYKDLLVVENPSTSSPGLAFLLATVDHSGENGWQDYWKALRGNGVEVVDGWSDAYYDQFSGSAGSTGTRPIVVSYGSSPPSEVIFADPPRTDAPTAVAEATCFRQVEFAGVLRGTKHETEARQLVDFLVSPTFQNELALNLFVYPSRSNTPLPPEFTKFAVVPATPLSMDPAEIAANREQWQDEWTTIVLR